MVRRRQEALHNRRCGYCLVIAQLAGVRGDGYDNCMIIIRFNDTESERRALGYLAGRFSFKSWASGETLVPEGALPSLAREGIPFLVQGPATYEQTIAAFR
jgi:hypothetical protein